MAIFKAINNTALNSHGAMRNCIEYVRKPSKTDDSLCFVSGEYLQEGNDYDEVYQDFLRIKDLFNKDSGKMYFHSVISWSREENITPEEGFIFGQEFAERFFDGFQTLVVSHTDKEHVHVHLVTNSISYLDGKHLHMEKSDLQRAKDLVDEMCLERGYQITKKGKHFSGEELEEGEITSWDKEQYRSLISEKTDSYLIDCALAVMQAKENCVGSTSLFLRMKELGWDVVWEEKRKHITFINHEGKKVRDSNLNKTFHMNISKEELLNEFARNANSAKQNEEVSRKNRKSGRHA